MGNQQFRCRIACLLAASVLVVLKLVYMFSSISHLKLPFIAYFSQSSCLDCRLATRMTVDSSIDDASAADALYPGSQAEASYLAWWFQRSRPMKSGSRKKTKLLVIVSSAPQRVERRRSIRNTWWKQCQSHKEAECVFFTDGVISDASLRDSLLTEQDLHKDIHFQPLAGGVNFGLRFLYHLRWASYHYDFDYFMRLDDDMMVCFNRLVLDLDRGPQLNFIWSWMHCQPHIVRPEESFIIISRDIVTKFLGQSKELMLCHPWADQQIALWVTDLGISQDLYYSDLRIHHDPPARFVSEVMQGQNLCHHYVAIHGVYDQEMDALWQNRGPDLDYPLLDLRPLSDVCPHAVEFDWRVFDDAWSYEPRLCSGNPFWNTKKQMKDNHSFYTGRESA